MKHATDATELSAAEPVTILGASADVKFDTGDKEESARARAHSPSALPLGPTPTIRAAFTPSTSTQVNTGVT